MRQPDKADVAFHPSSGNVFADLGLENAEELAVKADLAHAINDEIRLRGLTQADAGRVGGLTQPQVSRIARMKLDDFSQERLQEALRRLGVDVEIILHPRSDGGMGTLRTQTRGTRGGSTLLERVKSDPARAARIDQLVAMASLEQLIEAIMERKHMSVAELARRMKAKAPQVSREINVGLGRVTMSRLSTIAHALGYDFLPVLVPRSDESKRRRFFDAYCEMLREVPREGSVTKAKSTKARAELKKKQAPRVKQKTQ